MSSLEIKFPWLCLLLLLSIVSYGQICPDIYVTTLGKFSCVPNFKEQCVDTGSFAPVSVVEVYNEKTKEYEEIRERDWKGVLATLVPDGRLKEGTIYFPRRADTVTYFYPDKAAEQEIRFIDHLTFENVQDSITVAELDTLLNTKLQVKCKEKKQKVISYDFIMLCSNGYVFRSELRKGRISYNKGVRTLVRQHKIIYVGIYNIHIKNTKGRRVSIVEGFGWKILGN